MLLLAIISALKQCTPMMLPLRLLPPPTVFRNIWKRTALVQATLMILTLYNTGQITIRASLILLSLLLIYLQYRLYQISASDSLAAIRSFQRTVALTCKWILLRLISASATGMGLRARAHLTMQMLELQRESLYHKWYYQRRP